MSAKTSNTSVETAQQLYESLSEPNRLVIDAIAQTLSRTKGIRQTLNVFSIALVSMAETMASNQGKEDCNDIKRY